MISKMSGEKYKAIQLTVCLYLLRSYLAYSSSHPVAAHHAHAQLLGLYDIISYSCCGILRIAISIILSILPSAGRI
jgi:hypothetical protein